MKANSTGKVFSGSWVGMADETVQDAPCIWARLTPAIPSKKQRDAFIKRALKCIFPTQGEINVITSKGERLNSKFLLALELAARVASASKSKRRNVSDEESADKHMKT